MKIALRLTLTYASIFIVVILSSLSFFYWNTERLLLDENRKSLLRGPEVEGYLKDGSGRGKLSSLYIASGDRILQDPFNIGIIDREGVYRISNTYVLLVRRGNYLLGKDITPTVLALNRLKYSLFISSFFSILLSVLLGYILSQRFLSPIRKIISVARDIDTRRLDRRIEPPKTNDELMDLTLTINSMLDRISDSYRRQEQFIADVSHELRTPLTALLGYVRLLNRWGKDDKKVMEESLRAIEETAEGMEKIIETLLETIKTREDISLEEIDLESFLNERRDYYSKLYPNFQFKVLLSDSSKKILSSRPLLEIILNILVENAVRNSLDKKVIELGWENSGLFVRDYGKGIPLEERERIFERFYKNGEGKGYGLGLSLARKLARLLNIEIQIESEEGRGSTFYLIPKED